MDKYTQTLSAIPWLDVTLAAFAMLFVSLLWYALLFKKPYILLSGKTTEEANTRPSPATNIKGYIAFFLTCILIGLIDVHAQGNAIAIFASVILVWLFCMLDLIHATIWDNMPFKLFLIYTGNTLVNYLAAGLVFWLL